MTASAAAAVTPLAVTIDPDVLVVTIDDLPLRELELTAAAILRELALVAESAGTQRREASIRRATPGSKPPPSSPMCPCACPSRRDHWERQLRRAHDDDAAEPHLAINARHVIFQAAEDLRSARLGPRSRPDPDEDGRSTHWGPERSEFICRRYRGMPSRRGTYLESRRAGEITLAAFRRCRSHNGYGVELGYEQPPQAELLNEVAIRRRMGHSVREIATELDLTKTSVHRWITDYYPELVELDQGESS